MMEWIFVSFLVVSMVHMVEEYFYPGGFMDVMKRLNPKLAPFVTVPMAVVINSLQLLLCAIAIAVGENMLVFSMSVAGLIFINGLIHIMGCIKVKGYAPGAITGMLIYLPFSAYAYFLFVSSGQLSLMAMVSTGMLGLLYQTVPIGYLLVASVLVRVLRRTPHDTGRIS